MSVDACASLVERGDPDRFRAVMAAPPGARARLFVLYAFNLEVARAPWVTKEPLVAEMRLQWWRDLIEDAAAGGKPRAHEVATPLHALIRDAALPAPLLDRMVDARRWDCWREPFDDAAALEAYLDDTGGGLMVLAARALGVPDTAEPATRAYGRAAATANFLRAVADLRARGRQPLPENMTPDQLARRGLGWLADARAARTTVPKPANPALLAGWQAPGLLRQAASDPAAVDEGRLHLSEFVRRGGLLWQALSGRW